MESHGISSVRLNENYHAKLLGIARGNALKKYIGVQNFVSTGCVWLAWKGRERKRESEREREREIKRERECVRVREREREIYIDRGKET